MNKLYDMGNKSNRAAERHLKNSACGIADQIISIANDSNMVVAINESFHAFENNDKKKEYAIGLRTTDGGNINNLVVTFKRNACVEVELNYRNGLKIGVYENIPANMFAMMDEHIKEYFSNKPERIEGALAGYKIKHT